VGTENKQSKAKVSRSLERTGDEMPRGIDNKKYLDTFPTIEQY
jgi:hypothetical protein